MLARLGPAINSGRGLFLYGAAGNGKTSIAERVTQAFGQYIWIPRAIGVDGEIIRLYDPSNHEEAPLESTGGLLDNRKIDQRWIRIRRPTIVVGGELTMDNLEVTPQHLDRHLRSADAAEEQLRHAGDRRLRPAADEHRRAAEPLDRAARKAVRLPQSAQRQEDPSAVRSVDHLLDEPGAEATWSTRRSCGEFLTRSTSSDPTEEEFRELFKIMVPKLGFEYHAGADRLPDREALPARRAGRSAIANRATCSCRSAITASTRTARWKSRREHFDFAVENYFAMM